MATEYCRNGEWVAQFGEVNAAIYVCRLTGIDCMAHFQGAAMGEEDGSISVASFYSREMEQKCPYHAINRLPVVFTQANAKAAEKQPAEKRPLEARLAVKVQKL